ncbi:MAG: GDSL-type esterase/lipase family protein [Planctomycetota bacterium]
MGDSITQGQTSRGSDGGYTFRYWLWKVLIDAGVDFDFVGSMDNAYGGSGNPGWPDYLGHAFDRDHEGHWGWSTEMIRDNLPGWLQGYTADLAVIHIGHNDMWRGVSNPGIGYGATDAYIRDIVNQLQADNPKITIILLRVIPAPDWSSSFPPIHMDSVNALLDAIAAEEATPESKIHIVDLHNQFDVNAWIYDDVHPNAMGEMFMAEGIYNAFEALRIVQGASARYSRHALRFHGTGTGQQDRVRIPIDDNDPEPVNNAPCDVGLGDFTLDFWLRGELADNNTSNAGGDKEFFEYNWIDGNIIVDRDIAGGSEATWGISIAGGFVRFGTGRGADLSDTDNTIEGNVNVLDGNWHHVAVVRDAISGVKSIYVDGQLDFSGSAGASMADLSFPDDGVPGQTTPWGPYIVLGAEKHDTGPAHPSFNGFIDELRIWNTARSAQQIAASFRRILPAHKAGLVAYYRFEEGEGAFVHDSSSAGSFISELIAGQVGNGEWVSATIDPDNVAPVFRRTIWQTRTPEVETFTPYTTD